MVGSSASREREYLNAEEVGAMIGRSAGAIRNLVLRRAIPYRKPAGRLLFLRREIMAWIEDAPGLRVNEVGRDAEKTELLRNKINRVDRSGETPPRPQR